MSRALRSACLFAFVSTMVTLSMPGCSQQGQGERCDSINGDADCDSGLTCVLKTKLADRATDRCCPAAGTETDSRCRQSSGPSHSGGSSGGGSGGTGGGTSSGGASAGETSGGVSSLPEAGAAGSPSSTPGGASSASAGATTTMAGAANASAGAGGGP